ncbi:hypothetical protein [Neokomagataea thailandica]|uniref:ABC transporter permease protein n=1 Tax=Neokomagataea tanensis NBRC 106556 TaxID=1223519 RepID=A0ABQ0QJT1_9PROT|nr:MULTISPECIES: hypothetical protein [Neokomagataea]GBR47346.1 hypothetical protein AA106556_1421 [Neokomagataea tanensis NBRC 106556]
MSGIGLLSRQVLCELRKEFQQYRGLWMMPVVLALAPVAIAVIMAIFHTFWSLAAGHPITVHATDFHLNAHEAYFRSNTDNSIEAKVTTASVIGLFATGIAPVVGVIVTGLYASSAFLRDRRDQTILFWKSLPVPESAVVLARILFCCVGIPFAVFCVQAALVAFSSVMIMGVFSLQNSMAGELFISWGNLFSFLWSWFEVLPLAGLLIAMWWFPVWALLLLWSGIMRSYPLLWAVVALGLFAAVEGIAKGTSRGITAVWQHLKGEWISDFVFAKIGNGMSHVPLVAMQKEKLPTQMKVDISFWSAVQAHSGEMLAGFAIGALALVAAGYLRRRAGPL